MTMNEIEYWLTPRVKDGIARLRNRFLAVDVGANIGTWTAPLADIFDTVIAIEPDDRASMLIPRKRNVTIVQAACSDNSGEVEFFFRKSTGHNSVLERHPIGGEGMAPVPVIEKKMVLAVTLENVAEDGADFVKLDIEGGEVAALAGCTDPALWKRTFFVVECHDTFADVENHLLRLGKRVEKILHPLVAHPGHCWALGFQE